MSVTRLPSPDPHLDHDELLIAALAAGDASDAERDAAEALVRDCPACASLAADLRSIQAATSVLPAPVRTRDFRLTPEDAARLRPRGWRRVVGALGSPSFALGRPLAMAFTTLGLAGLLLATVPGLGTPGTATLLPAPASNERMVAGGSDRQAGGVSGAPSLTASQPGSQPAPAVEGSRAPASSPPLPAYGAASPGAPASPPAPAAPGASLVPSPPDAGAGIAGSASSAAPSSSGGATTDSAAGIPPTPAPTPASPSGPSPWLVGISIALLAAGLALFLARWLTARAGARGGSGRA